MRRLFTGLVVAVVTSFAAMAQEVRVEFRAAETEQTDGWTEMTAADGATYWVAPEAAMTNADVESAEAALDPRSGMPVVNIAFTMEGGRKFAEFTKTRIMAPIAIIVDGEIVSAPRVNEQILGGRAIISGNFTMAEAERIAAGIVP